MLAALIAFFSMGLAGVISRQSNDEPVQAQAAQQNAQKPEIKTDTHTSTGQQQQQPVQQQPVQQQPEQQQPEQQQPEQQQPEQQQPEQQQPEQQQPEQQQPEQQQPEQQQPEPPQQPDIGTSTDDATAPDTGSPDVIPDGSVLSVDGGRVTTLRIDSAKGISEVEILSGPAHGNSTVNPDQSIALVLSGSDYSGPLSISYRVNYVDGTSEDMSLDMNVAPVAQAAGWGMGQHYMLEEDADGDIVVETGDNHRKVYVSENDDALSRADIAALEGLAVEDIEGKWLVANPEYGGSEDMALRSDVAPDLWRSLIGGDGKEVAPGSHWLLFERGYEYDDLGRFMGREAEGESALHPLHVTAWGEGDAPVITGGILLSHQGFKNVVVSDIRGTNGMNIFDSENVLVSDTEITTGGINIRDSEEVTLHDSSSSYAVSYENNGEVWTGLSQGLIVTRVDGMLVEGSIFHHNAWEDGYDPDGSIEYPVFPQGLSHNVYFQWDTTDVTFRDNISSQGALQGLKLRGGGFAEDNAFIDNNFAVDMLGGYYKGSGHEHVGNFSFFADNVVTQAGFKDGHGMGIESWGMQNKGLETTWLDNIVAHLANPDDPADLAAKPGTQFDTDSKLGTLAFDNTISLNWIGNDPKGTKGQEEGQNLEGVDINKAMATTIQRYAALVTSGEEVTIDGFMDYLLSLADTEFDDQITARDIVAYFQDGFGMTLDGEDVDSHRFIPNNLAAGVRWDNRVNWDSGQTPDDGDSVDLGGNWVQYGGTTTLKSLELGSGGKLSVNYGKLEVTGTLETGADGARLITDGAGQFWTDGYAGAGELEVAAMGGRFANTGDVTGPTTIHAGNDAQAILATDGGSMVLDGESELRIEGSDADVGFDGDRSSAAILQMAEGSTLSFVADEDGFSTLSEFRSGHWDQDGSPVKSGVSLDGKLQIDLSGYAGGAGTFELIEVDALDGVFDDISVYGLKSSHDARIVTDYETDKLMLEISNGSGLLASDTVGSAGDGSDEPSALWDALTQGQGTFDEGIPDLSKESDAIPELLF